MRASFPRRSLALLGRICGKDWVPSWLAGWAVAPRWALTLPPLCAQPIAEQDCVRHICLEGQLIRVNQSQHCPQGAAPPRCGILGLAVRVGGDRCCPLWECACESMGSAKPPASSLYPYPSMTATPDLCAPDSPPVGPRPGRFPMLATSDLCDA